MIPAVVSSVGFAAFRGLLDNVTPLKVSLASNALNLLLDPLLIGRHYSDGALEAAARAFAPPDLKPLPILANLQVTVPPCELWHANRDT